MIVIIDNYDSFTYNLLQPLAGLKQEMHVLRNDALTVEALKEMKPDKILISSGPGNLKDTGICLEVIREMGEYTPILGISLGCHCIARQFGAELIPADTIMHGKNTDIFHGDTTLFKGIPSPFTATCYHSLLVDGASLPACLEVIATDSKGSVMGIAHRSFPVFGVQFHPESIQTQHGGLLLRNFVGL